MNELGPLSLMYSWQALICATACVGITRLFKTILNLTMGLEKRKANKWISQLLLPMFPVLVGGLYAALIPLRPEVLVEYAEANLDGAWAYVGYAGWGAACGQFATMLHGKLKDFLAGQKPES